MWTVGRWTCLLALAAVMLVYATEVDSHVPLVGVDCYSYVTFRTFKIIKRCYEQKPRQDCKYHSFLILNGNNKWRSISPRAQWLQDKIKKGEVSCPPDIEYGV